MTVQAIREQTTSIFKRQGVIKAAIFGSVARGEARKTSDVDFLVKLKNNKTLLDLISLKMELEEKLGRKVDILTYRALHPLLKKRVLGEQKVIYG